jgi:hypothetical protein
LVKITNEESNITADVRVMTPPYSAAVQAIAAAKETESKERTKQRWISVLAGVPIIGLIAWHPSLAIPLLLALALMTDGNPVGILREWIRSRKELPSLPEIGKDPDEKPKRELEEKKNRSDED